MEAKVVIPQQPRGAKLKNEGKNRQALRDIGNHETLQNMEGKISRPITRGFHAQLLAKAQAAENNKLLVVDDGLPPIKKGRALKKAAEAQKKLSKDPRLDTMIMVSSDEEENFKEGAAQKKKCRALKKAAEAQKKLSKDPGLDTRIMIGSDDKENVKAEAAQKKIREKSEAGTEILISHSEKEQVNPISGQSSWEVLPRKRNKVKTLSSILTARSQAASGTTNKRKDDLIVNIDAADVNDELAVVEYVDDLYMFYKDTEDESRVHGYMVSQPIINARMRTILLDWLIEVHDRFELMPETLYLTINIFDRYLSKKIVSSWQLQLVGISSMLIACKYEEIWAPLVKEFVCISDNAYVEENIRAMEKAILEELGWYLTVPTPYVFLVRFIKASVLPDKEMENMVFFLAELGMIHYSTIISYCPSMLAAAAVYVARCTLNKSPFWTETLKHYTGYSEEQLKDCAKLLVSHHLAASESEHKAGVHRKFSTPKRGAVSFFAPAKDLLAMSS